MHRMNNVKIFCLCLLIALKKNAAFIGWYFICKVQGMLNLEYHKTERGLLVDTHHQGRMTVLQYLSYTVPSVLSALLCTLKNV